MGCFNLCSLCLLWFGMLTICLAATEVAESGKSTFPGSGEVRELGEQLVFVVVIVPQSFVALFQIEPLRPQDEEIKRPEIIYFSYGQAGHFRSECFRNLMSAVLVPMSLQKAPSGCMLVDQTEDDLATKEIVAGIILSIDTRVKAWYECITCVPWSAIR